MSKDAQLLKKEILDRLADLVALDPTTTAVAMSDAALSVLGKHFAANLDNDSERIIRENYPSATAKLIRERAMSAAGVEMAVATATGVARIAIDYSPLSHMKEDTDRDFALSKEAVAPVSVACNDVFSIGAEAGLSTFGVAATMILIAAVTAHARGVHGFQLVRPLLDAIELILERSPQPDNVSDERLVATLRGQMGISRAEALRYIAHARKMGDDQR